MAGDIMKSMANKAKESMVGSYMTDQYNEEWEASQADEGGWLNQFRAIFKDAETSDAFKEAVRGLRDQMINGKTAEERGQARAAFNDAITAWKERKQKGLSYGTKSADVLPESSQEEALY